MFLLAMASIIPSASASPILRSASASPIVPSGAASPLPPSGRDIIKKMHDRPVYINGKLIRTEIYRDIKTNVTLAARIFDASQLNRSW